MFVLNVVSLRLLPSKFFHVLAPFCYWSIPYFIDFYFYLIDAVSSLISLRILMILFFLLQSYLFTANCFFLVDIKQVIFISHFLQIWQSVIPWWLILRCAKCADLFSESQRYNSSEPTHYRYTCKDWWKCCLIHSVHSKLSQPIETCG